MDDEREELEADIEKLHSTLQEDKNQWQFEYIADSDEDSEDEEDALHIDLEKQGSAAASIASISARSGGGRNTPSGHSIESRATTETQSLITEQQDDDNELFREVGVVLEKLGASTPATLESGLVLNRTYQEIVEFLIMRIELELAENRESQKRIEEELRDNQDFQKTRKRFPFTFGVPYFKTKTGSLNTAPTANEDVLWKRQNDEPDLDSRPEKTWYPRNKKLLTQAVLEDTMAKLLQPLMSRRELEEERLLTVEENSERYQEICEKIEELNKQIEEKRNTPKEMVFSCVDVDRVDWMKIANVTFEGRRDWMACKRTWIHSVDPRLNQSHMSPAEVTRLTELIRETNGSNWVYVAQQLGTGRTAFECLQYFQQNLNPDMIQRPWTAEEDKKLVEIVNSCQQMHFSWSKVSQFLEGRSSTHCYKRFTKLDPSINKGLWTDEEDAKLMAAVKLVGSTDWARLQELVPGRTREQCRERWQNCLNPEISGKPWTYEEDRKLLEGINKHGKGSWAKICKDLPGRTDNHCLLRNKKLEDWKSKSEWFNTQSSQDQEYLQGNLLPHPERLGIQQKNWETFKAKFGVYPSDYAKQIEDQMAGKLVVPRPPFMLGLANKLGAKVWERRIQLHRIVETQVARLKEMYSPEEGGGGLTKDTSISGIFRLQEAIDQLSQDCVSQRNELMARAESNTSKMVNRLPSKLYVRDLLNAVRGKEIHTPKSRKAYGKRGPKKQVHLIAPRLHKSMKVDAELRKMVRSNCRERFMKKGRPRRFFWDVKGEYLLSDDEMEDLKASVLNLYMKSLNVQWPKLLTKGRESFPDAASKLQQERLKAKVPAPPPSQPQQDKEEEGNKLRRSSRIPKQKIKVQKCEPDSSDPFSLSGQPQGKPYSQWQKERDYHLLEWFSGQMEQEVEFQPPQRVAMDHEIPAGRAVEVRPCTPTPCKEARPSAAQPSPAKFVEVSPGQKSPAKPGIGHGMSLVLASIQQAMEEKEAERRKEEESTGKTEGESVQNGQVEIREKKKNAGETEGESAQNGEKATHASSQQTLRKITDSSEAREGSSVDNQPGSSTGSSTQGGTSWTAGESNGAEKQASTSCTPAESQAKTSTPGKSPATTCGTSAEKQATTSGTPAERQGTTSTTESQATTSGTSAEKQATTSGTPAESQATTSTPAESQATTSGTPAESQATTSTPAESQATTSTPAGDSRAVACQSAERKLPNLPPSCGSIAAFKELLLKRMGLIKKAGNYYKVSYYIQKKDIQLASLINAGNSMHDLMKGTIDLSRMMNRVSQETDFVQRKKHVKKEDKAREEAMKNNTLNDFQILEPIRQSGDYSLLKQRFQSLFLWPALLSTVYPPFQRDEFSIKAQGSNNFPTREDKRYPLTKTKKYYRNVNKPKSKKPDKELLRKEKILKQQVQQLLADEDDPNPEVTLEPDSGDDLDDEDAPTVASILALKRKRSQESAAKPAAAAKKSYQRRNWNEHPTRQSTRHRERKIYEDRIYQKVRPRRSKEVVAKEKARKEAEGLKWERPHRSHVNKRRLMSAIVELNRPEVKRSVDKWNRGGYESEEEEEEVLVEGEGVVDQLASLEGDLIPGALSKTSLKVSAADSASVQRGPVAAGVSPLSSRPASPASLLVSSSLPSSSTSLPTSSSSLPASSSSFPASSPSPKRGKSRLSSLSKVASRKRSVSASSSSAADQGITSQGVFAGIPNDSHVLELDSDSDPEPSVATLLAAKRKKMQS